MSSIRSSESSEDDNNASYCFTCQTDSHSTLRCPHNSCKHCGIVGHTRLQCPVIPIAIPGNVNFHGDKTPTNLPERTSTPEYLEEDQTSSVCYVCQDDSHLSERCPRVVCVSCGKLGHIKVDCQERYRVPNADVQDIAAHCSVCQTDDHDLSQCPNAISCTVCSKAGHSDNMCPDKREKLVITFRKDIFSNVLRQSEHSNENLKDVSEDTSRCSRSSSETPKRHQTHSSSKSPQRKTCSSTTTRTQIRTQAIGSNSPKERQNSSSQRTRRRSKSPKRTRSRSRSKSPQIRKTLSQTRSRSRTHTRKTCRSKQSLASRKTPPSHNRNKSPQKNRSKSRSKSPSVRKTCSSSRTRSRSRTPTRKIYPSKSRRCPGTKASTNSLQKNVSSKGNSQTTTQSQSRSPPVRTPSLSSPERSKSRTPPRKSSPITRPNRYNPLNRSQSPIRHLRHMPDLSSKHRTGSPRCSQSTIYRQYRSHSKSPPPVNRTSQRDFLKHLRNIAQTPPPPLETVSQHNSAKLRPPQLNVLNEQPLAASSILPPSGRPVLITTLPPPLFNHCPPLQQQLAFHHQLPTYLPPVVPSMPPPMPTTLPITMPEMPVTCMEYEVSSVWEAAVASKALFTLQLPRDFSACTTHIKLSGLPNKTDKIEILKILTHLKFRMGEHINNIDVNEGGCHTDIHFATKAAAISFFKRAVREKVLPENTSAEFVTVKFSLPPSFFVNYVAVMQVPQHRIGTPRYCQSGYQYGAVASGEVRYDKYLTKDLNYVTTVNAVSVTLQNETILYRSGDDDKLGYINKVIAMMKEKMSSYKSSNMCDVGILIFQSWAAATVFLSWVLKSTAFEEFCKAAVHRVAVITDTTIKDLNIAAPYEYDLDSNASEEMSCVMDDVVQLKITKNPKYLHTLITKHGCSTQELAENLKEKVWSSEENLLLCFMSCKVLSNCNSIVEIGVQVGQRPGETFLLAENEDKLPNVLGYTKKEGSLIHIRTGGHGTVTGGHQTLASLFEYLQKHTTKTQSMVLVTPSLTITVALLMKACEKVGLLTSFYSTFSGCIDLMKLLKVHPNLIPGEEGFLLSPCVSKMFRQILPDEESPTDPTAVESAQLIRRILYTVEKQPLVFVRAHAIPTERLILRADAKKAAAVEMGIVSNKVFSPYEPNKFSCSVDTPWKKLGLNSDEAVIGTVTEDFLVSNVVIDQGVATFELTTFKQRFLVANSRIHVGNVYANPEHEVSLENMGAILPSIRLFNTISHVQDCSKAVSFPMATYVHAFDGQRQTQKPVVNLPRTLR